MSAAVLLAAALAACQSTPPREAATICQVKPNRSGVMFRVCRQGGYVEYTRLPPGGGRAGRIRLAVTPQRQAAERIV